MTIQTASEEAFTLLELLVTLTLISILTAIAIPQYKSYRQRAFDVRALSDLRSVALAEEAYYFDNEKYLPCSGAGCTELPGIARISLGTEISVQVAEDEFSITASNSKGTKKLYKWESAQGGLVEE